MARTKTLGPGCLIVLDSTGNVAGTIAGPNINDPWGNMAVIDHGDTATLVRQQCRLRHRRAGPAGAAQGDGAAAGSDHSAGQAAGGQRPDRDRRRVWRAGRSERVPDRPDRAGAWARMARSMSPMRSATGWLRSPMPRRARIPPAPAGRFPRTGCSTGRWRWIWRRTAICWW